MRMYLLSFTKKKTINLLLINLGGALIMSNMESKIEIIWNGPYSWPKYEDKNNFKPKID